MGVHVAQLCPLGHHGAERPSPLGSIIALVREARGELRLLLLVVHLKLHVPACAIYVTLCYASHSFYASIHGSVQGLAITRPHCSTSLNQQINFC